MSTTEPGADRGERAGEGRGNARKERVIHTRISEQLAEELRRVAEDLRVPVSNLVRTAIEETLSAVESLSDSVGGWVEEVVGEASAAQARRRARQRPQPAPPATSEPHPDPDTAAVADSAASDAVIAWQDAILHRPAACADCDRSLVRGDRAFVGLTAARGSPTVLCRACMERRDV